MPLNPQITSDFMNGFLGYGNPKGRWWFVGKEEGGGSTCPEVCARINYWNANRARYLDLANFHHAVGHGLERWFPQNGQLPKLQTTWYKLILIMLAANRIINQDLSDAERRLAARQFQAAHWGRNNSDTFLTEVLPFPCPGEDAFHYLTACWEHDIVPDFARDREAAFEHSWATRTLIFRALWDEGATKDKKRVIVFYAGLRQQQYWEWLIGTLGFDGDPLIRDEFDGAIIYEDPHAIVVRTHHPSAHLENAYWLDIGTHLAEMV